MTSRYAAALAVLLLSARMPPAFAACVNAKCTDTTAIERARATIQATCGCTRDGQTHGKYTKCVKSTLRLADVTALIPEAACRKLIMKCENASICGRPSAAVCCVAKGSGKVKSSIVGSPARCKKGNACGALLGLFSKFDACAADGTCAGPVTTTTTTTSTAPTMAPTTTSTTTTAPTTTSTTSTTPTTTAPTTTSTTTTGPTTTSTTTTTSSTSTTTTTMLPGLQGALTPTLGRFNYNLMIGLAGANAACNTNFPGTHACTYQELQAAQTAGQLAGLTDTAAATVTSFWAIDSSMDPLDQCQDDVSSLLNWEYATAHTPSRGTKVPLDNATGTLGALQTDLQCNFSGASWVGCCS